MTVSVFGEPRIDFKRSEPYCGTDLIGQPYLETFVSTRGTVLQFLDVRNARED